MNLSPETLVSDNPWETSPSEAKLVNIGTHSLFTRIMGPQRKPGEPLVIVEQGGGAASTPWIGMMRVLARTHRIMSYNRAGLSGSDSSPKPGLRSSLDIAADFEALLGATGVAPPYILVAQSYAGIQIRTWMQVYAAFENVAGCVFVDAMAEDSYRRMPIREAQWGFLFQLDIGKVLGYDEEHKLLTEEEYKQVIREAETNNEKLAVDEAADRLASYKQYECVPLGRKPISVIKGFLAEDLRRLNDEAERVNLGKAEQRRVIRDNIGELDRILEDSERQQLKLSTHGRMVFAKKESGHAIFPHEPEIIMDEIRWMMNEHAGDETLRAQ